mmetsp:Transcript_24664/g.71008  ORF Transcript_24664/g.71008 Transcript_24664/m.71008 type:complete len:213 (+) Transcript_24664:1847-2485(+)
MMSSMHEQVLVRVNCIWKLVHLEERVPDVAHDLEPDRLNIVWDLIKSHAVHLDRCSPFLLLEVYVPHVYAEPPTEWVLLVLYNLCVDGQRLVVVVICLVLDSKVQAHCISEVNIELVEEVLLLPESAELPLLLAGLLSLLQGLAQVLLLAGDRALLHEPVYLLLHLAKLLLRRQLRLLLQRLGGPSVLALVHGVKHALLALPIGCSVAGSAV